MGLKDLLLNKGWAGTTMTNRDTSERLDPILRQHYALLFAYEAARARLPEPAAATLEDHLRTLRTDIGKIAETILSGGLAPYNGIDLEVAPAADATDERLRDLEDATGRLLADEAEAPHQIRTRALLAGLQASHKARLDFLQSGGRR